MNHDAAHCLDCTKQCPWRCYRRKLNKDLSNHPYLTNICWQHFRGTDECLLDIKKKSS